MTFFLSVAAATALASPVAIALAGPPATPIEQPIRPAARPTGDATVLKTAAALRPGEFHWAEDASEDGPLLIQVSIADQKLYAWRNGALFAVSTVSTGRPGHATPPGAFPILEKQREHRSNRYANAPMPFMQRLTQDGVALHAGKLPGYPASHGCVRLPLAFAQRLFAVTRRGDMVIVMTRGLADPAVEHPSFDLDGGSLAPAPTGVLASGEPALSAPVAALLGPLASIAD